MKSYLTYLLVTILTSLVSSQLNTQTCDNYATCSPYQCINVTNVACNSTASTINVTSAISAIACNPSCTQSTLPICSNSSLAAILAKGLAYGLKAAYCTDQYLIIHSDGTPNHKDTLSLIPRPPGDSSTGTTYSSQCVTRAREKQFFSFKIPLNPVALSTASASINNVNAFIGNMLSGIALPVSGPVAFTVTGAPIFPAYNDQSQFTWTSCEVDACNAHVGQGFDYHYHGDPYSNIAGKCLYSPTDYTSTSSHPPLIGFSADGFMLYGRYLSTSAIGYSVALDDCGGHDHDSYGYHYHSQVLTINVTNSSPTGLQKGSTYTAYIPGPYKCWKGDISLLNNFWDTKGKTVSYGSSRMNNNLASRSDYSSLRQCCNSNNYLKNY